MSDIIQISETVTESKSTGTRIVHGHTPDGVDINLWLFNEEKERTPFIATYPKAVCSSLRPFGPERGKRFCLVLSKYNDTDEKFNRAAMYQDFIDLKNGDKTLLDLRERFHYIRDAYYLGAEIEEQYMWEV